MSAQRTTVDDNEIDLGARVIGTRPWDLRIIFAFGVLSGALLASGAWVYVL